MTMTAETRAAIVARSATRRVRERVAAALRERFAGMTVTTTDAGVVLSARGLGERFLDDAALRWIAGELS